MLKLIIHINGKIPKSADKNPVFLGIVNKRYPPKKKKPAKIKEYPTIYPTIEDNPNVIADDCSQPPTE